MKKIADPVVVKQGKPILASPADKEGYRKTLTYQILQSHNIGKEKDLLHLRFDSLTSHDITYVSIIQTARASGIKSFEQPYVLTNCHNSLCAVGGTINEDDHRFALSAAIRYGGIYVPAHYAVIHSYNREMMSGCGRMILGSDSHTRYGALGTMGIGEGGGELAKQLTGGTYDIVYPQTVLVYLHGKVRKGIGPHDVALAIIAEVYQEGFVKNAVMEFIGEGIHFLSQDFRNGIDVMTTETACFSSIWETDEITRNYYRIHHREEDYRQLKVEDGACYDRCIDIDLSKIECMIALPMHPSYALPIRELNRDPYTYLKEADDRVNRQLDTEVTMHLLDKIDAKGKIHVDQAVIGGCSGGIYENIYLASRILKGRDIGNMGFSLSVYPDSLPVSLELLKKGIVNDLLKSGAIYREAFCGPCFGAGDVPSNNGLSIRHTTRNFPNREGSKPDKGQLAMVALMDARSIAATAVNHGVLTPASEIDFDDSVEEASFDPGLYETRVYNGYGKPQPEHPLQYGPNIKDWPQFPSLSEDLLIKVISYIDDPVTTTDELIPSGETSSYRSNPEALAEFTLSRKDPSYVGKAKQIRSMNIHKEECELFKSLKERKLIGEDTLIASAIYANKPGDGSAREQAASCQKVLGGIANFAKEYATKRYRSNCINWGILPFVIKEAEIQKDDWILVRKIRESIIEDKKIEAYRIEKDQLLPIDLEIGYLNEKEKQILLNGCLINDYRKGKKEL